MCIYNFVIDAKDVGEQFFLGTEKRGLLGCFVWNTVLEQKTSLQMKPNSRVNKADCRTARPRRVEKTSTYRVLALKESCLCALLREGMVSVRRAQLQNTLGGKTYGWNNPMDGLKNI